MNVQTRSSMAVTIFSGAEVSNGYAWQSGLGWSEHAASKKPQGRQVLQQGTDISLCCTLRENSDVWERIPAPTFYSLFYSITTVTRSATTGLHVEHVPS